MRADNKQLSQTQILLCALPNVEFVHGFPGIPASPDRPQATIRGTLEVRIGNQAVKAKWLKVEFRKIETIPTGNGREEFIDLIGQGPMTLWQAHDENDNLTTRDFPVNIRIPETIPPSILLERGCGIRYEVHATLCVKGKRGLFRREASSFTTHTPLVIIEKHELHSTWPIYAQPESRQILRDDGLVLIVDRGHTCFAPGDRLAVITTLKTDNLTPVVLRSFEFALEEVVTYKVGAQSHNKKIAVQRPVTRIVGEQKLPVSLTLYGGTQHRTELGCMVPSNHTTCSITAGRHIDVSYKIRIKAFLDYVPAIMMELPVIITNWPRHTSAEMTRRIGTAPNLTLKSAVSSRPSGVSERSTHVYQPQPLPPTGPLPGIPNGHSSAAAPPVPPKNDTTTTSRTVPPSSTNLGSVSSTMNPYSFQQNSYSTSQAAASKEDQLPSLRARTSFSGQPSTISESTSVVTAMTGAGPDEFGYNRQHEVSSATAPARIGQRSTTLDSRASDSEFDTNNYRQSQYSQDGDRSGAGPGSTTRRTRAISRLKVMNVTNEIPEETSPLTPDPRAPPHGSTAPRATPSSSDRWPTAEEEKQKLYETAKASVQRAIGSSELVPESTPPKDSTSSNGHISPPLISSLPEGGETHQELAKPNSAWASAEQEKQRLYERAQAQVLKTHGIGPTSNTPYLSPPVVSSMATPAPSASVLIPSSRPSHDRSFSESTASQEFTSAMSQSIPSKSAGAALYSKAMSSINRAASAAAVVPTSSPRMNTPEPRRNASLTGSTSLPSNIAPLKPEEDKSVLRYIEAKRAVQRRQLLNEGIIPDEAPMPYHQLFGGEPGGPSSGSHLGPGEQRLSEKELLRRKYEDQDAAAAATRVPPSDRAYSPAITQRSASMRSVQGPPVESISEKERMRRAFEARDEALRRAGLTPPPIEPQEPGIGRSLSTASYSYNKQTTYDITPPQPPLAWGESSAVPLTASQEKAQLAKQYAQEKAANNQSPPPFIDSGLTEQSHDRPNLPPTRERSFKSDSSEVFLRRDPTISEGKKRASQIVNHSQTPPSPPPPLPPHPPQEYIEETQNEDRRTTLLDTLPLGFTPSLSIGFDSLGKQAAASGFPASRPG